VTTILKIISNSELKRILLLSELTIKMRVGIPGVGNTEFFSPSECLIEANPTRIH